MMQSPSTITPSPAVMYVTISRLSMALPPPADDSVVLVYPATFVKSSLLRSGHYLTPLLKQHSSKLTCCSGGESLYGNIQIVTKMRHVNTHHLSLILVREIQQLTVVTPV